VGAKAAWIEPGLPRKNGYCESSNARLWDACFDGEIFGTVREA
jgi:hypothetical protein